MTKTVDLWTSKQKQDLIADVKSLIDSECPEYSPDDVMQVVLVGSYANGVPTADSDVDILVEVSLRDYTINDVHRTSMKDGKKIQIAFRDRLKTPMIDQDFAQKWHINRYSLTNDEMRVGRDNEEFLVYWSNQKKNRSLKLKTIH
jgi:predicted nucleotidyltransferase